jgi:sporulation protein YlmC with PRC-barrel domain
MSRDRSSEAERLPGRMLDAHLSLLDRQVTDPDGYMVGKVDDVELAYDDDGRLYCAAILVGPAALGPRLGGWLGRTVVRLQARWHRSQVGPYRIPFDQVGEIGSAVRLVSRVSVPGLEDWAREHVISKIPGAQHDSDE